MRSGFFLVESILEVAVQQTADDRDDGRAGKHAGDAEDKWGRMHGRRRKRPWKGSFTLSEFEDDGEEDSWYDDVKKSKLMEGTVR